VNLRFAVLALVLSSLPLASCDDAAPTATADAAVADVPAAVDAGPIVPVTDRQPGAHQALALGCDPTDPTRCLMPWPSIAFTQPDPAQVTGLRLQIPPGGLVSGDRAAGLERADGFSRASPLVVAFPANLDAATLGDGTTGALRLVVAEGPTRGTLVPLRSLLVAPQSVREPETGIVAYPRTLLAPATEHIAVVLDSLRTSDGAALQANDETRAALGLQAPRTPAQERLRAWHAPTRALLAQAGIDPARVVRVWGFVTRSREQPLAPLRAMRARAIEALRSGAATVTIDSVATPSIPSAALVVNGHVRGLPRWVTAEKLVTRDANGPVPVAGMTYDAPFRVLLPAGGMGAYPAVVFGHGMGGEVTDSSFDDLLATAGAAKVNIRFDGLTETEMATTFLGFLKMSLGVEQAASVYMQALAGGMAVIHSMRGQTPEGVALPAGSSLRDILARPMLGSMANPLAGRRANPDTMTWAGGSLGGTTGLTMVNAEPAFIAGVANVPGAAWSHFLIRSVLFDIVRTGLQRVYGSTMDIQLQVAISQTLWDEIDGAAWADGAEHPRPILIQESMGDPVLPNLGTEFAAASLGAVQVGAVLTPIVGVATAPSAEGRTAITQYRVPASVVSAADIHGFAATHGVHTEAALEQIRTFLTGAWAGQPRVVLPQNCVHNTPAGSCDFSASR
jgi:hypothetical protein